MNKLNFFRVSAIALSASVLSVGTANAEPRLKPYIAGFVGVGFTQNADLSGEVTPPGGQQTVATTFGEDINFGAAIGASAPGLTLGFATPRFELELSHLASDADQIDFSGNGAGAENNTAGDVSRTLLIANVLFDFETGGPLTPYVGVGAGLAFTNSDLVYGGPVGAAPPISVRDNGVEFAGQIIAGVSYQVSDNISVFGDGRYTRVFGFDGDRFNPGGLTGNVSDDLDNFSLNVGLRYQF